MHALTIQVMQTTLAAADVPALYRSILTLVVELERCDGRVEAHRIRDRAVAAYSGPWDERHRRRLVDLEERLRGSIAVHRQPVR